MSYSLHRVEGFMEARLRVLAGPGHHFKVWHRDGREVAAVTSTAAANAIVKLDPDYRVTHHDCECFACLRRARS